MRGGLSPGELLAMPPERGSRLRKLKRFLQFLRLLLGGFGGEKVSGGGRGQLAKHSGRIRRGASSTMEPARRAGAE